MSKPSGGSGGRVVRLGGSQPRRVASGRRRRGLRRTLSVAQAAVIVGIIVALALGGLVLLMHSTKQRELTRVQQRSQERGVPRVASPEED